MDINLITKLAAAGAMGVSIFCIIKVYELLKAEQKKDNPRPTFLKSIYVSMAFAVLMTVLSLGIEIVRHNIDASDENIEDQISAIATNHYYSLNKNGNPEAIKLSYNNTTHTLSEALPDSCLKNCELKLEALSDNKHIAVKKTAQKTITFGYVSNAEIKTKALSFLPKRKALSAPELWTLGMAYSPSNTSNVIKYRQNEDKALAVEYFSMLIQLDDKESNTNKEKAIKLLIQPELMSRLKPNQYTSLIKALKSGHRATPWDKYELAQVYLSRSWQTWNKDNSNTDFNNYQQLLADYRKYYENNSWIRDTVKYANEHKWYQESKPL